MRVELSFKTINETILAKDPPIKGFNMCCSDSVIATTVGVARLVCRRLMCGRLRVIVLREVV